jgi:putative ABC transport system permease protein
MILNETAVSVLGLTPEEALGIRISNDLGDEYIEYSTVIGVVKNFHFESLRENIGALSLSIGAAANKMAVKLSAEDLPTAIAEIGELWSEVAPGQPFNYYFMDQSFNDIYQMEQRLSRIFMAFTSLSIIIACLGLFGLAAFNAEKRTKEIGVRKVLGASVSQVAFRLTADFLKMVGIAIVIALPIGRFAMNKWLEDFSYQVEVGWWVYGLAALLAVSIAILTVCYQSIKAAIVNPVKSLQSE